MFNSDIISYLDLCFDNFQKHLDDSFDKIEKHLLMICNKISIDPENYSMECFHEWEEDMSADKSECEAGDINQVCTKCGSKRIIPRASSCSSPMTDYW